MERGGSAVLIGALAPGVNAPTWAAFRNVMLALWLSLGVLLAIAWHYNSGALVLHVVVLTSLAAALFVLLQWFVSETGLVKVEDQMKALDGGDKE